MTHIHVLHFLLHCWRLIFWTVTSLAGMLPCHLHAHTCPSPSSHRAEHTCVGIFANLVVRNPSQHCTAALWTCLRSMGICVCLPLHLVSSICTLHSFVVCVINILSCFFIFLFCFAHKTAIYKIFIFRLINLDWSGWQLIQGKHVPYLGCWNSPGFLLVLLFLHLSVWRKPSICPSLLILTAM